MKVLMIEPTPFFADRGCHVRIRCEVEGLQALGHEVLVCTYPLGNEVEGIATRRTWPVPWYKKLSAGPSFHKYYLDLLLLGTVRRAIREWKPDLIHAHLHEGGFIAALANGKRKLPVIFDHQGSLTGEVSAHGFARKGGLQHRLLARIERWVESQADWIVTSTTASAESLKRSTHMQSDKVSWLEDVVDVRHFELQESRETLRRRLNIPVEGPVLIYVGVLTHYQGIDVMLEALTSVQKKHRFHAVIIGFPNEALYAAKAAEMGLKDAVTFLGRVSFDALPEYLCAADLAISAKLPGSEGNGKLLTYMAAGLPIVAFDTAVNRQILGDTAKLVGSIDAQSLADAVVDLLEHEQEGKQLGVQAKERVAQQFSVEQQAQQLARLYDGLLKKESSV